MLVQRITQLHKITQGQVIAIGGKTRRRSQDTATGKAAIHIVNAWATDIQIRLGQTVVDAKSNEITAIPKPLEMTNVLRGLVTINAMGRQTEIAAKIVDEGADDCSAVKGNQPTLHEGIKAFFLDHLKDDFARIKDTEHHTKKPSHGRIDERSYSLCEVLKL